MKYLFVHQNAPGQFKHIAPKLASNPDNEVVFLTHPGRPEMAGVRKVEYTPHRDVAETTHHYLRTSEQAVLYAQGAARAAMLLQEEGFEPDVIIAHPGWGETILFKDIFPSASLIHFCEFYYSSHGADINFDPEYPSTVDNRFRTHFRNAHHLLSVEMADYCYSPTHWQKSQFPQAYQDKIEVFHDGIDCDLIKPNPDAELQLASGVTLRAGDPIITYVARNLEPYRGFHTFIRSLPRLFKEMPDARVVIIGDDGVSYGQHLPDGETYRQKLLAEVQLPMDRVHFLGRIPYSQFLQVLQTSAAHIYLTYPFVLSWSCLEAMASECLLIASKTQPVEEVITDGENGILVDFFDTEALGHKMADVLKNQEHLQHLRKNARKTVQEHYSLRQCQTQLLGMISRAKYKNP